MPFGYFDNSGDNIDAGGGYNPGAGYSGTLSSGTLNSLLGGSGGGLLGGINGGLAASALSGLLGTYVNNQGINSAMNTIQGGANQAQNTLGNIYGQQQQIQQPYQQTGNIGLQGLQQNLPYLTSQITNADIQNQLSPNYQFQLQQGQMANQRAANVAGGGFGGNALKGLQDYTQNFAQNAYQNAFNNALAQKQNIYNTLSGIANIGQNAANTLTEAGGTYGTNVANLQGSLAKALAQGQTAQAQQNAGALQSIGNTALLSSLLAQQPNININTGGSSGGGGGGGGGNLLSSIGSVFGF